MLLKLGINYGHVGFIGLCVPLSFMLTKWSYKQDSTREGWVVVTVRRYAGSMAVV